MNRVERRVRNMINPYSTAFARWWCHSGRYIRLPHMITGGKAAVRPGLPRPAAPPPGRSAPEVSIFIPARLPRRRRIPGERSPRRGSAKPIACDATAGSDLDAAAGSRTLDGPEDDTA